MNELAMSSIAVVAGLAVGGILFAVAGHLPPDQVLIPAGSVLLLPAAVQFVMPGSPGVCTNSSPCYNYGVVWLNFTAQGAGHLRGVLDLPRSIAILVGSGSGLYNGLCGLTSNLPPPCPIAIGPGYGYLLYRVGPGSVNLAYALGAIYPGTEIPPGSGSVVFVNPAPSTTAVVAVSSLTISSID